MSRVKFSKRIFYLNDYVLIISILRLYDLCQKFELSGRPGILPVAILTVASQSMLAWRLFVLVIIAKNDRFGRKAISVKDGLCLFGQALKIKYFQTETLPKISGIFTEKMKYWLFIVAGLMGCNGSPTSQSGKSTGGVDQKAIGGGDHEIEKLAFTLRTSGCAYFGGIEIEGSESRVFNAYKRLLKIAPDSLWVRLSYSDKPVVRFYALEALVQRNSPLLDSV